MIIQVLGCSGSLAAGARTTSFLVDGDVLIDAGTGVGDLPLAALTKIEHIFVTHSHLDHVLSIGLLADSVMRARRAERKGPIVVHALPETLAALRAHIFNGVIWPDFTRIPNAEHPVLSFRPIAVGETVEAAGKRIEVLPAEHTVPAVGYAVDGGDAGWWVFTGDTGPNPSLWQRLQTMRVAHLVIETAFGDDEQQLARISGHLSPTALGLELAQLPGSVDVHITHIKPGELASVMSSVGKLTTPHRIRGLAAGESMQLSVVRTYA